MVTDPSCIFCKIIAGELPSTRIDEDERTVAFMAINPASYGHALVAPRAHSVDLHGIGVEDLAACSAMAQRIAGRQAEVLGADGINLLNSAGAAAWQTVFHFHLQVIPRYQDDPERDPLTLPWVPTPGDPARIAAAAEALRSGTPA